MPRDDKDNKFYQKYIKIGWIRDKYKIWVERISTVMDNKDELSAMWKFMKCLKNANWNACFSLARPKVSEYQNHIWKSNSQSIYADGVRWLKHIYIYIFCVFLCCNCLDEIWLFLNILDNYVAHLNIDIESMCRSLDQMKCYSRDLWAVLKTNMRIGLFKSIVGSLQIKSVRTTFVPAHTYWTFSC